MIHRIAAWIRHVRRVKKFEAWLGSIIDQIIRTQLGAPPMQSRRPFGAAAAKTYHDIYRPPIPENPKVQESFRSFLELLLRNVRARIVARSVMFNSLLQRIRDAYDKISDAIERGQPAPQPSQPAQQPDNGGVDLAQTTDLRQRLRTIQMLRWDILKRRVLAAWWVLLSTGAFALDVIVIVDALVELAGHNSPLVALQCWAMALGASFLLAALADRGIVPLFDEKRVGERGPSQLLCLAVTMAMSGMIAVLRREAAGTGDILDWAVFGISLLAVPAVAVAAGHCVRSALHNLEVKRQKSAELAEALQTYNNAEAQAYGRAKVLAMQTREQQEYVRRIERAQAKDERDLRRAHAEIERLLNRAVREVLHDPHIRRIVKALAYEMAIAEESDPGIPGSIPPHSGQIVVHDPQSTIVSADGHLNLPPVGALHR